jgi:oxaloacetate decarboxylase alpha subunit/pyruvate carboxylase subunit B
MITGQVKDLCYGLYGKTAVPINPELQKKALKGYSRGEEPITCRPAEVLEPELEKAKAEIGDLAVDLDDLILYAQFPVTGRKYLEWKYGKAEPPASVKPITIEEVRKKDEIIKKAKAGKLIEPKGDTPQKSSAIRTFNVFVDNEYFNVEVDPTGEVQAVPAARAVAAPAAAQTAVAAPAQAAAPEPAVAAADGTLLLAPMPGMIVKYEKKAGNAVKKGDTLVILEAMKMENALSAPCDGTVQGIKFASGDSVAKGAVLCVIS